MQVLVRKSDIAAADATCSICGQGFRLYWESGTAQEQARAQIEVRDAIHSQHLQTGARSAHSEVPFTVPNWAALPQFAGMERRRFPRIPATHVQDSRPLPGAAKLRHAS